MLGIYSGRAGRWTAHPRLSGSCQAGRACALRAASSRGIAAEASAAPLWAADQGVGRL